MSNNIKQSKYSTGQKHLGGAEYTELVVRDGRGLIVGYALLDPREQNYNEELDATKRELEQDFGR